VKKRGGEVEGGCVGEWRVVGEMDGEGEEEEEKRRKKETRNNCSVRVRRRVVGDSRWGGL
jgi:hypothetical protein